MIGWTTILPPARPLGATGDPTLAFKRVGTGAPDSGGQIGVDVTWEDANGSVVGQALCGLIGATPIDQTEYEQLLDLWRIQ